jgi:5'-3' exonuclease
LTIQSLTKERSYLIDCSVYFFRFYFSIQHSVLSKSDRDVASTLAFFRWFLRFLHIEQPQSVACCFDESLGTGYRHSIDPHYKQNRALPDDALAYQLLAAKKMIEAYGVPVYASHEYEADDLIAALALHCRQNKWHPVVISRDKDLGQILHPESGLLWDFGYSDALDFSGFENDFGVKPSAVADYLAIVGDAVDNIHGVKGIGKVTASALFRYFSSWQDMLNRIDDISTLPIRGAKTIQRKIRDSQALIDHNIKLTRLYTDCLDGENVSVIRKQADTDTLYALLDEFNAPQSLFKQVDACLS